MSSDFLNSEAVKQILEFKMPRYNELPVIGLYMDQVIITVESSLGVIFSEGENNILTATMVSNYIKQKLVSPPVKKKYSTKHVAYLNVVCLLKRVYSISEICKLIEVQIGSYPIETAYDYFCAEMEHALRLAFGSRDFQYESLATQVTDESEIVRSAAISIAHQIYIKKYLEYLKEEH